MARILVIEDNRDLADAVRTSLEIEGHEVEVALDGHAGLLAAGREGVDLVILDLMLPGLDGHRVLRAIRERDGDLPVLILTARDEEADKVLGFRLGADDYVTKPFGRLELLARVAALLRRARPAPARGDAAGREVLRFGDVVVDEGARSVTRDGRDLALTPKEFDLLIALMKRRGAVVSRLELLREVWGHTAAVMTRTVDLHVFELRRKVEADASHPRHILTVRKAGYRFVP